MSTTTLDTFVAKRQDIQSRINDYRLIPMNLTDITKSGNRFYHRDSELTSTSLNSLLGVLGVKENLINDIKDDVSQWAPLHEALSNIKENKVVTAVANTRENSINRIFNHAIKEETPIDLTSGLRYTEEFLRTNNTNLDIKTFEFDPQNICVNINFRTPDSYIDVFGDDKDVWKSGFGLSFHLNKLMSFPFFERLICSNGMTAIHRMTQRFVNSTELTQRTFDRQVLRYTTNEVHDEVKSNCKRLRNNNASLREFFNARKIVNAVNKELANEFFPDHEITGRYRMLGIETSKQNARWLSTANSNVNSYDLFNNLTNIASHRMETDEQIATRMEINRLASDMFFTGPDFATLAPDPFRDLAPANLQA